MYLNKNFLRGLFEIVKISFPYKIFVFQVVFNIFYLYPIYYLISCLLVHLCWMKGTWIIIFFPIPSCILQASIFTNYLQKINKWIKKVFGNTSNHGKFWFVKVIYLIRGGLTYMRNCFAFIKTSVNIIIYYFFPAICFKISQKLTQKHNANKGTRIKRKL